ncbi:MAG TPA: glycosyltransferase family 2 protein [Candidatus Omnitrophota bacterium]|nr:glycosyltransferase family 2 protein [Candidatus Omnitrophota bacterium]
MSIPLSIIILAKNEELNIKECIESVHGWADEVVIIDDGSSDQTLKLARAFTDKVFTRKMDLEGRQRNFGVSKAKNDWVMMLDCDERPTPELKQEIAATLSNPPENVVAFWIPQICYLGNVRLKYGGWSNPHIRLYNKNFVQWSEAAYDVVHPGIKLAPGTKGRNLKESLIHYNYANIEDFIRKVNNHSTLEAVKWYLDGRKMSRARAMRRTVDRFFRRFVRKKGYKDGYYGFVAAALSGFYEFAAYSKYCEIKDRGIYLPKDK